MPWAPFRTQGLERSQVPFEHVEIHVPAGLDHPAYEGPQNVRSLHRRAIGLELDACVEIPSDHQDGLPGIEHGALRRPEEVGAIEDDPQAVGALDAPAGFAGFQKGCIAHGSPELGVKGPPRSRSGRCVTLDGIGMRDVMKVRFGEARLPIRHLAEVGSGPEAATPLRSGTQFRPSVGIPNLFRSAREPLPPRSGPNTASRIGPA